MVEPGPGAPGAPPSRGRVALQFVLGLAALVAVCALLGLVLDGPARALGAALAARAGLPGLFLAVTLAESSPLPLMGEPLLLLALEGGLPLGPVVAVGCAANVAAALLCYAAGAALDRLGLVDRVVGARRPEAEALARRHGAWALVVASLTPVPFATLAWTAGALRMPLLPYALASLVRIPKVVVTLAAVRLGWSLWR